MDGFNNYSREEAFDPFTVMLFKGLQVVCFMFFLAFLTINPEALSGKIDTKAEFIITVTWPDNNPDDVDTYVEDPLGNIVWYHQLEAGFLNLDRDDRGDFNDYVMISGRKVKNPLRQEIVSMRGIVAGEYTVNIVHYLATTPDPVEVKVRVDKVNPRVSVVYYGTVELKGTGYEATACRFTLSADGTVTDVNTNPKPLVRETRRVRAPTAAAGAGGGARVGGGALVGPGPAGNK
jgi:hypothetical protein